MKTQTVILECGMEGIINLEKETCLKCKKDINRFQTKTEKVIPVELVGLAKWDIHICEDGK